MNRMNGYNKNKIINEGVKNENENENKNNNKCNVRI